MCEPLILLIADGDGVAPLSVLVQDAVRGLFPEWLDDWALDFVMRAGSGAYDSPDELAGRVCAARFN